MRSYDAVPGVPAAGHVTAGGWWHSGGRTTCSKCKAREEFTRKDRRQTGRPGLGKDHGKREEADGNR